MNTINLPLLSIELGKELLTTSQFSHKDEEKLAVKMGATMLKIMGYTHKEGRKFLEKLRIYGLLAGGTDFDVCMLYPVFPNPDPSSIEDFFFVFSTSKKYLRYHILEEVTIAENYFICNLSETSFISTPEPLIEDDILIVESKDKDKLPSNEKHFNCTSEKSESELGLEFDDFDFIESLEIFFNENTENDEKNPNESKEDAKIQIEKETFKKAKLVTTTGIDSQILFENGVINEESLKVLERLAELIVNQSALIDPVIKKYKEFDENFRYKKKIFRHFKKGRDNSKKNSPLKYISNYSKILDQDSFMSSPLKKYNSKRNLSSSVLSAEFKSLIDFIINGFERAKEKEKDKENHDGQENIFDSDDLDLKFICNYNFKDDFNPLIKTSTIRKKESPYEIIIYNLESIKMSPLFPKLLKCYKDHDDDFENIIFLEIESIFPFHNFNFNKKFYFKEVQNLISRFFLDLLGAAKTLHLVGFVHGDISQSNVGFNSNMGRWQLFDFDQSRTIAEAENVRYHGGTDDYTSLSYQADGIFHPCDDFVSVALTCTKNFGKRFISKELWAPFEDLVEKIIQGSTESPRTFFPDLDACYLESVEIFLKLTNNQYDPSIESALPLLAEIKKNRKFDLEK